MITLEHVRKSYADVTPLKDVCLNITDGETVSIIGPSGTGKSTLMRLICMLDVPTSGKIYIDGDEITAKDADLSMFRRKMGMVFQNYNLFPHLTVLENVMKAPVDVLKMPADEAERNAVEQIKSVGLDGSYNKYPHQLSGGQKQRVAIARTLAMDPEIIFFDEPTSALDPAMTAEVTSIIRKIANGKRTLMVVTHEMQFAKDISTRVLYLDQGGIYEDGTPEQIFDNPQRELTKNFINNLRSISFDLCEENNDLPGLFARITEFCYRSQLPGRITYHVESVFEEICTQILSGRRQHVKLTCSTQSTAPELTIQYSGSEIITEYGENSISRKILDAYADVEVHPADDSAELKNSVTLKIK